MTSRGEARALLLFQQWSSGVQDISLECKGHGTSF